MHRDFGPMAAVFVATNIVIAAGYIAVPFLVLRYLPLTRAVLFWGAGFLLTASATNLGLAFAIHTSVGWFWTLEFVAQGVCVWAFILLFHRMLRAANHRRTTAVSPRRAGEASTSREPA